MGNQFVFIRNRLTFHTLKGIKVGAHTHTHTQQNQELRSNRSDKDHNTTTIGMVSTLVQTFDITEVRSKRALESLVYCTEFVMRNGKLHKPISSVLIKKKHILNELNTLTFRNRTGDKLFMYTSCVLGTRSSYEDRDAHYSASPHTLQESKSIRCLSLIHSPRSPALSYSTEATVCRCNIRSFVRLVRSCVHGAHHFQLDTFYRKLCL